MMYIEQYERILNDTALTVSVKELKTITQNPTVTKLLIVFSMSLRF